MGQQKAPPLVMTHQRGQEQTCDDQAGTKDIIPFPPVGRKSKGGIFMKAHIDLPWGRGFGHRGTADGPIQVLQPRLGHCAVRYRNIVFRDPEVRKEDSNGKA